MKKIKPGCVYTAEINNAAVPVLIQKIVPPGTCYVTNLITGRGVIIKDRGRILKLIPWEQAEKILADHNAATADRIIERG